MSSGKENIANLSTQLEELKTAIGNLEANNKSLSEDLEELKATKEVPEETGTDSGSLDIDMDALVDQIVQQTLDEHPEWTANNGTGTTPYEGPHVGTPDSGELPTYNFGERGQDGIDKSVTVY